jgi:ABC-type glutathione transport system ATPase component
VRAQGLQVVLVELGLETGGLRELGEPLERRLLVAGDARDLHERGGVARQRAGIEGVKGLLHGQAAYDVRRSSTFVEYSGRSLLRMISLMHAQPVVAVRGLDHGCGPRPALRGVDLVVRAGEVHGLLGPAGAGKTTLLRVLAGDVATAGGSVLVQGRSLLVAQDLLHTLFPLARTLAEGPRVLLVDEPAPGFDHAAAMATRALVARHAARGGAVVWATRRLDTLHGLASAVTVLAAGRVRYCGSVEALVRRVLIEPPASLPRAA